MPAPGDLSVLPVRLSAGSRVVVISELSLLSSLFLGLWWINSSSNALILCQWNVCKKQRQTWIYRWPTSITLLVFKWYYTLGKEAVGWDWGAAYGQGLDRRVCTLNRDLCFLDPGTLLYAGGTCLWRQKTWWRKTSTGSAALVSPEVPRGNVLPSNKFIPVDTKAIQFQRAIMERGFMKRYSSQ